MLRVALVLAVLAASSPAVGAPGSVRLGNWKVDCWPGRDEFAVGCEARATSGPLAVKLDTGDSQLFASVSVAGCAASDYVNWWRDEIASRPDRARRIARALNRRLAELGRTCPAARGRRLDFAWLPDIANVGDPPPKWVAMHKKPRE